MGPETSVNPMQITNPNAKIHYNTQKVLLLAFTGSLGGLSVGYNCGIVAGACLYLDQVFSDVTLADKSVRNQIIYTIIERCKYSGVWSHSRCIYWGKPDRFARKKEDDPAIRCPHNYRATDSVPSDNSGGYLRRESDSGAGHGHLDDGKSGVPLRAISVSAQGADMPHILLRVLHRLHLGAHIVNSVCL